MNNRIDSKNWYDFVLSKGIAVFLLFLGVILLGLLICIFSLKSGAFNWSENVDIERITKLSDSIGGIVGSLWALAGVILFYLALENQKKNSELNKQAVEQQIKTLNLQITEFREQRKEFGRSATAQENTEQRLTQQLELMKIISIIDKYATLAKVNSDLAKIETDPEIQNDYKLICREYITKLESLKHKINDEPENQQHN